MAWASRALGTCTYVSPQESETRFTSPIPVLKLKTSFPSRLESIRTCHPRGHSRHQSQSEAIRGNQRWCTCHASASAEQPQRKASPRIKSATGRAQRAGDGGI